MPNANLTEIPQIKTDKEVLQERISQYGEVLGDVLASRLYASPQKYHLISFLIRELVELLAEYDKDHRPKEPAPAMEQKVLRRVTLEEETVPSATANSAWFAPEEKKEFYDRLDKVMGLDQ